MVYKAILSAVLVYFNPEQHEKCYKSSWPKVSSFCPNFHYADINLRETSQHYCYQVFFLNIKLVFFFKIVFIKFRKAHNNRHNTVRYHNKCSSNRENTETALRMLRKHTPYNQPCIADFVMDHDASRIPADLPHITCPKGTRDRCIEIQLPWNVSFHSHGKENKNRGKLESKIIHIPSGCYEDVKKSRHPPIKGPTIRKSGKKDHHRIKTNMLK